MRAPYSIVCYLCRDTPYLTFVGQFPIILSVEAMGFNGDERKEIRVMEETVLTLKFLHYVIRISVKKR